jgi:hypothetical protein
VLGDQAHIILAFWKHLDTLDAKGWDAARAAEDDRRYDAQRLEVA